MGLYWNTSSTDMSALPQAQMAVRADRVLRSSGPCRGPVVQWSSGPGAAVQWTMSRSSGPVVQWTGCCGPVDHVEVQWSSGPGAAVIL